MDFELIVTIVRDWLSENWTDLGVLLLTVCNFASFVIKKIYSWRLKKNDSTQSRTFRPEGQTNISPDREEHEGNQCDAESDERRNQIVSTKISFGSASTDNIVKDSSNLSDSVYTASPAVLNEVQLLYKVKQILVKPEMSNDSKIEILKFILEVEDEN